MPAATLSAATTMKPRFSMAWARRWRKGASSSTIRRLLSSLMALFLILGDLVPIAFQARIQALFLHPGGIPPYHDLTAAGRTVAETDAGPRPLQEGHGDEDAKPHMLALAAPPGAA